MEDRASFVQEVEGGASAPLLIQELDSVTIIGMGPTCSLAAVQIMRQKIPFDERNPIWVINDAARAFAHSLAWNVHDLNHLGSLPGEEHVEKQLKWYREEYKRPVATLRSVPGLNTLIYPIKKVVETWQDSYFFAAPSYMLAYAHLCGAKTYRLYGLDFDYPTRTEYEAGRCATEYWCGRLRSFGARFEVPDQSSLFDLCWAEKGGRIGYGWPLYGYFKDQPKISVDDSGRMTVDDSDIK